MQLDEALKQGTQIIDKSLEVSSNPAISLLVGWQSLMILFLGFAVFWLVKDKFKMTREFVGIMTDVNRSLDDIADIVKTNTDEIKESRNKIIEQIKESIANIERGLERIQKM